MHPSVSRTNTFQHVRTDFTHCNHANRQRSKIITTRNRMRRLFLCLGQKQKSC